MTLRISDIVPVVEVPRLLSKKNILCITEDENMDEKSFFTPLAETFEIKDGLNVVIKPIGHATNIYKDVCLRLDDHKMTLADSYYDDCVVFLDFDRVNARFYGAAVQEHIVHRERIKALVNIDYVKLYVIPSYPTINSFFLGFYINNYSQILLAQSGCCTKRCNVYESNKHLVHGNCVNHFLKENGYKPHLAKGCKEMFKKFRSEMIDTNLLSSCLSNHMQLRSSISLTNSFSDLEIGLDNMEILFKVENWYSYVDLFISQYYQI